MSVSDDSPEEIHQVSFTCLIAESLNPREVLIVKPSENIYRQE